MKNKKQIDSLFKERFENFEATPSPKVWSNIHAQLNKEEEDRKAIPLWFKIAGVAALLALLFTIGSFFFNPPTTHLEPSITNEDVINKDELKNDSVLETTNEKTSEIASEEENNSIEESDLETNKLIKSSSENSINNSETKIAYEEEGSTNSNKNNSENNNSLLINSTDADTKLKDAIDSKTANAVTEDKNAVSEKEAINSINESLIKKEGVLISETTITEEAITAIDETNDEVNSEETPTEESEKPSIFDAINDQNTLEDVVAKNDNNPDNRWDVTPNFAPVFYNSLEEGSSIDPTFSDNAKSSEVNFSYGVQVSYNVNNRLSIRSGVNNLNLSYNTGGIELGTSPVSAALQSIDYGNKSVVVTAVDKGSFSSQNNGEGGTFGDITPKATNGEAEINQKINYYEIPLEVKYSLLNKKFGVNLIGGLSTLFLGNNEISVNAGDFESVLGEANNLSSVSFTTNVGMGFNYKFSKKFMFNIEPMFKYQLNPYTDSSVDYKPYYIGIYSGLSFKF